MKKYSSITVSARTILSLLLLLSGLALVCAIPLTSTRAAGTKTKAVAAPVRSRPVAAAPLAGPNPASGTIHSSDTSPVNWSGTSMSPGGGVNTEGNCVENVNCETFTLTVSGTPADWTSKKLQVLLTWQSIGNEYDLYIHKDSNSGPLVTSAVQGPALTNQVAFIDPTANGTGTYTIHVVYDTTPVLTDIYTGSVSVLDQSSVGQTNGLPVAAPADTGTPIGYENFEAPGLLTNATSTSSGGVTVEYMGRGAGEPSVGANWNTGIINFQSDLETLFITFDDSCGLTNPKATWVNRRAPTSVAIDSDPIGFTDRQTGRVFASELTLLGVDTSKISFTDSDGLPTVSSPSGWTPDQQAQGLASAVDHQTMGGGPYNLNAVPPPVPSVLYPNAVYYCSQDIATAFCSRSDNGGLTFGNQIPLYNLTQCGGLHGHVKVAPDGTVYVPNRACGSSTALVVSTDNGLNWTIKPIQNASVPVTPATDDPAVAIDAAGKVYCLFSMNGKTAAVGMSTDKGSTWKNIYDVAAGFGLNQIAFPAAAAGGPGRAAVAFYGSKVATGDSSANTFTGVWHLYVAHTFDGGDHWTTTDVTPQLPMQRMGLLRGGGGPLDRNLLDFFDITVDRDGRVIVGYVNGCAGGPCSQAANNPDGSINAFGNAYTATATIARQSSGRRMLAANDPVSATSVPGMPFVTQTRLGNTVKLAWNEADTGGSAIQSYQILRGVAPGNEQPLGGALPGTQTSYIDSTATDATKTYYYKVVATNAVGSSCANNEIAAPYVGDSCSGVIIHRNLPTHPESTGGGVTSPPTPQYLIDYIAVSEPPLTNLLKFTMKVGNLVTLPPNSRWRIVWDSARTPDEQYYVGMTTDQNGTPSYEYGTVQTLSVVVVGIPTENPQGSADAGSYDADGTISISIDKSKVGSPLPGELLGAVNGRTFNTGDAPGTGNTTERSTLLIDHTFVKGNTDNSYPASTYTVQGNTVCSAGSIEPVSAVSRKTHGGAGTFDVDLPLTGQPGVECRNSATPGNHTVVITFSAPVTQLANVTVSPAPGRSASVMQPNGFSVNNTQVTVNLTNVSNAQTLSINLLGLTAGANSGNVAIPMSVLLGDVNGDGTVLNGDVGLAKSQVSNPVTPSNFRDDVNSDGNILNGDVGIIKGQVSTSLH
jgi:hypothetical protein